jgi:hypothetical protein
VLFVGCGRFQAQDAQSTSLPEDSSANIFSIKMVKIGDARSNSGTQISLMCYSMDCKRSSLRFWCWLIWYIMSKILNTTGEPSNFRFFRRLREDYSILVERNWSTSPHARVFFVIQHSQTPQNPSYRRAETDTPPHARAVDQGATPWSLHMAFS